MLTFNEFLEEEAKKPKKIFISHLDKMRPLHFIDLVSKLDKKFKGVLSKDNLSITEKIDGSALRIGQDADNNAFIESSTSASMFNVGDFLARDQSKGYSGVIGKKFDGLLKGFKNDKKFQSVLTKFNNGAGIKIIGEILYTPMGIDALDNQIKFIRITYDKAKLGSEWTFVPFKVEDLEGNHYHNSKEIMNALYKISSKERKYVPPTLSISGDIDISIEINKFKNDVLKKYKNIEQLVTSRKKADKELKELIKNEILTYQKILSKKIISFVNNGLFGKDFEGLVIELSDGTVIKIITDTFKSSTFTTPT